MVSLLPTLKDVLQAQLNAEEITAELRTRLECLLVRFYLVAGAPPLPVFLLKRPSNKLALWENLKTISECFEGVLSAMCGV